jgi:hypothetical protein
MTGSMSLQARIFFGSDRPVSEDHRNQKHQSHAAAWAVSPSPPLYGHVGSGLSGNRTKMTIKIVRRGISPQKGLSD